MECAEGHVCPGLGPAMDLGRPAFKALASAASGQKAGVGSSAVKTLTTQQILLFAI